MTYGSLLDAINKYKKEYQSELEVDAGIRKPLQQAKAEAAAGIIAILDLKLPAFSISNTENEIKCADLEKAVDVFLEKTPIKHGESVLVSTPLTDLHTLAGVLGVLSWGGTVLLQGAGLAFSQKIVETIGKFSIKGLVISLSDWEALRESLGADFYGAFRQLDYVILSRGNVPKALLRLIKENLPELTLIELEQSQLPLKSGVSLAEEFVNLIITRRSIRFFTDEGVSRDILDKILLCARMAPSGHNRQTWRFTVLQNKETIERLKQEAKKTALEKGTSFFGFNNPPVVVLVSNSRTNPTGLQDASAAIENILLAAHSYGLGACWLNCLYQISDEEPIRTLLNQYKIPKSHIVYGTLCIGYPDGKIGRPSKKGDVIYYYDEK